MSGRLFSGPNVSIRRIPGLGNIVGFRVRRQQDFTGAWFVEMQGQSAAFIAPGSVNGMMAQIGKVKLDDASPPQLKFPKLVLDSEARGYIAAEVTCDPENKYAVTKVEIVQVADPDTHDGGPGKGINAIGGAKPLTGNRARAPLAMLRQRKGGGVDVYQIARFDLQMRIAFSADKTPQRFFFFS